MEYGQIDTRVGAHIGHVDFRWNMGFIFIGIRFCLGPCVYFVQINSDVLFLENFPKFYKTQTRACTKDLRHYSLVIDLKYMYISKVSYINFRQNSHFPNFTFCAFNTTFWR